MVNRVHDPEPGPDSLFQELGLGVPVQCVATDTHQTLWQMFPLVPQLKFPSFNTNHHVAALWHLD